MQTRTPSFRSVSFIAKRVCALLCTAILMPALTACSMPRIAGRAEAEQRQSPCEKAYFDATADNKIAHDQHQHIIRRYFSAQQAVSAWTNTAAQCPARFAEGTLRSAQARHMARALGDQLSVAVVPITLSRFDDVESLDVDSKSLATAAQAEAALRAKRAGFDGVQLHAAHGYLISQFLSGFYNHRSDAYGGTPENRARLLLEILGAVRTEVGRDYPVLAKINCEDFAPGGFSAAECIRLCREILSHISLA